MLPFNLAEDNPIPLEDLQPAPTNAPPARDTSVSPPDDDEHTTDTSVPDADHGVATGDMDLDLVLRQDRRDLRAAMAVFRREERSSANIRYDDMMVLVSSLGRCGRKFRRETIGWLRAIVSEVYSAPRVTATATRNPKPWDFNDLAKCDEAEKLLDEQRPHLPIGSPMCTAFSNMQNLNKAKRDP